MKSFEYAAPRTLAEALGLLSKSWGESELLAGGTDLLTSLKQNITAPRRIVSLRNISDLRGIRVAAQSIGIGAMTPLGQIATDPDIQRRMPAVVSAIRRIGSPQILAAGTLGGDLCQRPRCWYFRNGHGLLARQGDISLAREGDNRYHAIFETSGPALFVNASSLAPALIALGAQVGIIHPAGEREVPLSKFFRTPRAEHDRETILAPNEIVTGVSIPVSSKQPLMRNATYEVRHRRGLDWPYVTASVAFEFDRGVAKRVQVVLGHVAPVPWPSPAAAQVLEGVRLDASIAARCGEAAAAGARPLSRNAYKVQLVKTAVKRAVLIALS